MDFGYPQTTDSKILQEYITQQSSKLEVAPRPPMAVTNAVSWRSETVKYRRNEVFLDVIENVNLLVLILFKIVVNDLGELYWKRFTERDCWLYQNEGVPLRYARASSRCQW